jgi:hypothetical protein
MLELIRLLGKFPEQEQLSRLSVRRLGVSGPISGKESTVGVCDGE